MRPSVGSLDDDVGELGRIDEPSQRVERDLPLLVRAGRLLADLPGGDLEILAAHGVDHVRGVQVHAGHPLRIDPNPHAVVFGAEGDHIPDAVDARQLVLDVDRHVVAQIELVVAIVGRGERDDHQDVGRSLAGRHAGLLHNVGQRRQGEIHLVLHQHLGEVHIDARLERDLQRVAAVVRAVARHVEHFFHAVDELLDRRGDRLGDDLALGPGIVAVHLNRRRNDRRVLRDRKRIESDSAAQSDHDRQHGREDRPVDEEPRKRRPAPASGFSVGRVCPLVFTAVDSSYQTWQCRTAGRRGSRESFSARDPVSVDRPNCGRKKTPDPLRAFSAGRCLAVLRAGTAGFSSFAATTFHCEAIRCKPLTMTRSPVFSPLSTTRRSPG